MEAATHKPRYPWYVRLVVGGNPVYTVFRALVWAALLFVLFKFVLLGIRVQGQSMEPTFHNGQVKFINRIAYLRKPPQRGDVVAFRLAGVNAVVLKRVIGLPGETVAVKNGAVYINGKRLDEPYAKGETQIKGFKQLEPHEYWLIGDNRDVSDHFLKYDYQIVGKLLF